VFRRRKEAETSRHTSRLSRVSGAVAEETTRFRGPLCGFPAF
jgi:hypothetical protein